MTSELSESARCIVDATVMGLRDALARAGTSALAIVVDPTLKDPLSSCEGIVQGIRKGSIERQSFGVIHTNFLAEKSPYLLHIRDEHVAERGLNDSVRVAVSEALGLEGGSQGGRSVCAWIVGAQHGSGLSTRLAAAARLIKPDGERWPLRYWDPRVLWHLPRVLGPQQHARLRRSLGRWHWLDPMHALTHFSPDPTALPAELEATPAPMAVDEAVWASLSRVGTVNQVLSVTHDWGVLPIAANAKRIDQLIQQCRALGFTSEQDELVFCTCALTSRDDFYRHPKVADALSQGSRQGSSVMQALQTFDDEFWDDLRDSAPAMSTPASREELARWA